ncbi:MAG: nucleotide disphospho-sugar-binding domain-containing protein [Actinomycetes bacterium]
MSGKTILFWPESAYGPTNNCIGIGNVLKNRGHNVVFAAESSWGGRLSPLGFKEELVDLSAPPENPDAQSAGQFWKDFIRDTSPEFRKPTVEQLETFITPTRQALIDGAIYCEPRLKEIIAKHKPDVIIEDNVVCFPATVTAGVPFVRVVSCNPLEIMGDKIAPPFSGLAENDPSSWASYHQAYEKTQRPMWEKFNSWVVSQGAPALPDMDFIHTSKDLNMYVYPTELDYTDKRPLGKNWHRIDSSVRSTDAAFELPSEVANRPADSKLIYLSLGSLGSADVDLMKRLIGILGKTKHKFIVSKGPQASEFELAPNMIGAEFLPQISIIPKVDLVITHGGNNTTTESVHFGKPMIVLPLFWDQYDNAQRVHEKGHGIRLATYAFKDEELTGAIEKLLNDSNLLAKLKNIGEAVRSRKGIEEAATKIEALAK